MANLQSISSNSICVVKRKKPEIVGIGKIYQAQTNVTLFAYNKLQGNYIQSKSKNYFCPEDGECVAVDAEGIFAGPTLEAIRVMAGAAPVTVPVRVS